MKPFFLGFLLVVFVSCNNTKSVSNMPQPANRQANDLFDFEGHRGCRGLMPENTIPAFLKAMEIGVTTLEMDAVITKDGRVILSHEPFFNHEITTKQNGEPVKEDEEKGLNIYGMTYAETQTLDVGLRPHPRFPEQQKMAVHKPLLAEVIDSIKAYCKANDRPLPFFNIETKSKPSTDDKYHPAPNQFVEVLMGVIKAAGIEKQVIIQSFDFRTLQYLHKQYPNMKTSALIEVYDHTAFSDQLVKLGFTPDFYSPGWELVTEDLVAQCHQHKVKLVPWTINDKPTMRMLIKLGVDGLISDYPNLFKNL